MHKVKWEYKKVHCNFQNAKSEKEVLDELGKDGWELAAVNQPSSFLGIFLYFKRKIS